MRDQHIQSGSRQIAARFYGHPERDLILIGVIGSKSRTAITWMTHYFIENTTQPVGLLNRAIHFTGHRDPRAPEMVAPHPTDLHQALEAMRSARCRIGILELTTAGVQRALADGLGFHVLLFHGHDPDPRNYNASSEALQAKFKLCSRTGEKRADCIVVNRESANARALLRDLRDKTETLTYGTTPDAQIRALDVRWRRKDLRCRLEWPGGRCEMSLPFKTQERLSEALAALALGFAMGQDLHLLASRAPGLIEYATLPHFRRDRQMELSLS
ncbi:MAG: Mur ligase family protein [Opitutales bacterium]